VTLRLVTVIGARPQFVKAAVVSRRLREGRWSGVIDEILVHTGQHYDAALSDVFFHELAIPKPRLHLGAGSGSHGEQTGAVMRGLEFAFSELKPDVVMVYGDTNSTLAAALVAAKTPVRLAHVEAGLRSFRSGMPEEVNRVVTDRLSQYLFCPTETARRYLASEGIEDGVHVTGDVMYDGFLHEMAYASPRAQETCGVTGDYVLATLHRAENTDDRDRLASIVEALDRISRDLGVILPLHPRSQAAIIRFGLDASRLTVVPPVPYRTMLGLLAGARAVATDSGGLQKEAYFAATPCVTLRDETEWGETIEAGWNRLAPPGTDISGAIRAALDRRPGGSPPPVFGDGDAARRILDELAALA
jgi:UDP-N-acetylglucosamine 2-epimerase